MIPANRESRLRDDIAAADKGFTDVSMRDGVTLAQVEAARTRRDGLSRLAHETYATDQPRTREACGSFLYVAGYRHTAGNRYARLREKGRRMDWAEINADATGHHSIRYL